MFNDCYSARIDSRTYPHPTVAAEKITQPKITSHPRPPSGGRSMSSIAAATPFSYTDGAAEVNLNALSSSHTSTCVLSDRGVSIAEQDESADLRGKGGTVADGAFYAAERILSRILIPSAPNRRYHLSKPMTRGDVPSRSGPAGRQQHVRGTMTVQSDLDVNQYPHNKC